MHAFHPYIECGLGEVWAVSVYFIAAPTSENANAQYTTALVEHEKKNKIKNPRIQWIPQRKNENETKRPTSSNGKYAI